MPYKYVIHRDQNLIRQTLWGTVTAQELRDLAAAMWSDPDYRPRMDILADLLEARVVIPYDEMLGYTQYLSGNSNIGRQAIVVSGQLEFGLARMYEQLTEQTVGRESFRVFFSLEQAERWLSESPPAA